MAGIKPLLETVGALLPRIRAWHASPHDFDKFSLDKIGTGQGAASYGPGIYAAESPKVSGVGGEYWKEFAGRFTGSGPGVDPVMSHAVQYLEHLDGDRKAALAMVNEAIGRSHNAPQLPRLQEVRDLLASDKQVGPRVYELDIKAKPDDFLQWDKPLSEQPDIYKKLDIAGALHPVRGRDPAEVTGEKYFRAASRSHPSWMVQENADSAQAAMNMLARENIPGIRYADAASRNPVAAKSRYDHLARAREELYRAEQKGAPQSDLDYLRKSVDEADALIRRDIAAVPRTYNYVLNNPELIEILRKYAVPGMVTGGGAITAYEPQGSR